MTDLDAKLKHNTTTGAWRHITERYKAQRTLNCISVLRQPLLTNPYATRQTTANNREQFRGPGRLRVPG